MINIKIAILMIALCGNLFLLGIAESNDHEVYQAQKKLKEWGMIQALSMESGAKKPHRLLRF